MEKEQGPDDQEQMNQQAKAEWAQERLEAALEYRAKAIEWADQTAVSFPLNTTPVEFAQWLVAHTGDTWGLQFPAGRGFYQLDKAYARRHPMAGDQGAILVIIPGTYCTIEGDAMNVGFGAQDLITFNILPRSAGRVEVQARCHVPEIATYYEKKLQEIGQWYEESGLIARFAAQKERPRQRVEARATAMAARNQAICAARRNRATIKDLATRYRVTSGRIHQILRVTCPDVIGPTE